MSVGTLNSVTEQGLTAISTPLVASDGAVYRFSVAQYMDMMRLGVLASDEPVELLEGLLVTKMAINPPHRTATHNVRAALERVVPPGWYVEQQQPIVTAQSMPEPDVAVIRGSSNDYATRHPRSDEVAIVIEVADSSLLRDETEKKRIYAAASIPIYWLVNLQDHRIEVYSNPSGPDTWPDYRNRVDFGPESEVPVLLDGQEISRLSVGALLPRS